MAELKRSLGYPAIIALSLTAMMGTGMFFGTTIAAQNNSVGNASLIAWGLLVVVAIYVSYCFAELSSMFPKAGGVYEFAKRAYGRFPSFLIGWTTWLVGNITATVMIVAGTNYIFPASVGPLLKIGVSLLIIVILNLIAYKGIEASTKVLIVLATMTIVAIIAVIVPASFQVNFLNFKPFFSSMPIFILVSLFFIMESLFGWESATFLSEETVNPEKVIPRSLIISTILAGVLALLIPMITLGVIPWRELQSEPFLQLATAVYGIASSEIFIAVVALTMIGAAAGVIVSNPRLLLALARDKLFIEQLSDIHPKNQTPYKAIFFQLVVSILVLFAGFGAYETLLALLVPLALLMYVSVLIAVVILRYKDPYRVRSYKAPFGKIGPIIVSVFYIAIIGAWIYLDPAGLQLFQLALSFILFGIPIFLLLVFYYNPSAVIGFNNSFAGLSMKMEDFFLPLKVRRQILDTFTNMEGKTVLEYGAGVGTLTKHLVHRIGPHGKIIATDISEKNLRLLGKRVLDSGMQNVQLIHDEHQFNRIHPDVPRVDLVFSVGMLTYIQDPSKVLREMNELLPEHGKIVMVDYVNYFKLLPDPKWLTVDKNIAETFKAAGFSIKVRRIKGFLWNYLFVYGIKTRYDVPFI